MWHHTRWEWYFFSSRNDSKRGNALHFHHSFSARQTRQKFFTNAQCTCVGTSSVVWIWLLIASSTMGVCELETSAVEIVPNGPKTPQMCLKSINFAPKLELSLKRHLHSAHMSRACQVCHPICQKWLKHQHLTHILGKIKGNLCRWGLIIPLTL